MDVDGGAVEDQIDALDQVIPRDPWDQAISRPSADHHWSTLSCGELGGLGSMNPREQEELLLFAGTRKQQKAIRKRRRGGPGGHKSAATGRVPPDPRLPRGTEGR